MSKIKNWKLKFENRIQREYDYYIRDISKLSKGQIIDKAYQITMRYELLCNILSQDLTEEQYKVLMNYDAILEEFYYDFKIDDGLMEPYFQKTISYTIKRMVERYYDKRNDEL